MLHTHFECELLLIRHGESLVNTKPHLIAGRSPKSSLTDRGREQAHALGRRLRREEKVFDRIFTSTLDRAKETARIMAREVGYPVNRIKASKELVEFSQGDWEGRVREEVYSHDVRLRMGLKVSHFIPPRGESQRMVERRVSAWLEDEVLWNTSFVRANPHARIAIVAHGMVLKVLLHYLLRFDSHLIWRVALENCSISRARFDSRGWHIDSINDAAHVLHPSLFL